MRRVRVGVVPLLAVAAIVIGVFATGWSSVGAYSPSPPLASTSTSAAPGSPGSGGGSGPTTTSAGGVVLPEVSLPSIPGQSNNGQGAQPASGSTLPFTGGDILGLLLIALILLIIGYVARRLGEQRRSN